MSIDPTSRAPGVQPTVKLSAQKGVGSGTPNFRPPETHVTGFNETSSENSLSFVDQELAGLLRQVFDRMLQLTGNKGPGQNTDPVTDPVRSQLDGLLPKNGQVNEEQLYAALIQQRLGKKVGPEGARAFEEELAAAKSELRRPNGYVPVEQAAMLALSRLVDKGVLPKQAAEAINGQAFYAAQLDGNDKMLYDSRGSAGDPTIAQAERGEAMAKARNAMARIDSGVAHPRSRPLHAPSAGTTSPQGGKIDGANGFLWKPISESNGNLVILLPKELAHDVAGIQVKDVNGRVVDRGRSNGYANGGREHFRFDKPGSQFPPNSTVEIQMKDGSTKSYQIPDPSRRYD